MKTENFEKNKQTKKTVWRCGREGATHKIWPGSVQRFLRNLSLWMTDGRRMDTCATTVPVALLTKSSRAKNSMLNYVMEVCLKIAMVFREAKKQHVKIRYGSPMAKRPR